MAKQKETCEFCGMDTSNKNFRFDVKFEAKNGDVKSTHIHTVNDHNGTVDFFAVHVMNVRNDFDEITEVHDVDGNVVVSSDAHRGGFTWHQ